MYIRKIVRKMSVFLEVVTNAAHFGSKHLEGVTLNTMHILATSSCSYSERVYTVCWETCHTEAVDTRNIVGRRHHCVQSVEQLSSFLIFCILKETGEDYGYYLRNSTYCSNATVFRVERSASTVYNKERQQTHYDNQEFKNVCVSVQVTKTRLLSG